MNGLPLSSGPAFASLRPTMPARLKAPPALAGELRRILQLETEVERLDTDAEPPVGFYILPGAGPRGLFVKVVPRAILPLQLAADRLARFVADHGIAVSRILPGYPKPLGEDHSILGFELIHGRFAKSVDEDVRRVGAAVGRLHAALALYPEADEVRAHAAPVMERLRGARRRIESGASLGPEPERLRTTLAQSAAALAQISRGARVTHGDLNYANVLFTEPGDPVILDFEEAWLTWVSPLCDVAMLLQRFALQDEETESLSLGRELLKEYLAAAGPAAAPPADLAMTQRGLAARALLLLAEKSGAGVRLPPQEWTKFFDLHDAAIVGPGWLRQLSTDYSLASSAATPGAGGLAE